MKDFIFDFETLGKSPGGMVVSLAAIVFDRDTDYNNISKYSDILDNVLYVKFALDTQKPSGRFPRPIDPNTAVWWKKQGPAAQKELLPSMEDEQLNVGIRKFLTYLKENGVDPKNTKGYCRGQSFDFPLMTHICEQLNIDEHNQFLRFWNQRDIRTVIDEHIGSPTLKLTKEIEDQFVKHDARHDVVHALFSMVYARALSYGVINPEDIK